MGLADDRADIRVDFPALGRPMMPTSARSLSSRRSFRCSPSLPGCDRSGARLLLVRKAAFPSPPLPPLTMRMVWSWSVRSPIRSPVSASKISVPQGTRMMRSLPEGPVQSLMPPLVPSSPLMMRW